MALDLLPDDIKKFYEVHQWRNAYAVLAGVHPQELADILAVLRAFRLRRSAIATGGGNKSLVARQIDQHFTGLGWVEKKFATSISVDDTVYESPTHSVDCYKNRVAIEVEWNNKDPFFDRDLNNFRLLFELRAIDVGVIITRCDELQRIFNGLGRGPSYGEPATHMRKLLPKVEGGGAGGCPLLVFGISAELYVED